MCDVNIVTGEVTHFTTDFVLPGIMPLHFTRNYSSTSTDVGPLGYGWKHNLEVNLRLSDSQAILTYMLGKTVSLPFPPLDSPPSVPVSGLTVGRPSDLVAVPEAARTRLIFARAHHSDRIWLLARKEDAYGNSIHLTHDAQDRLAKLIDSEGRLLTFHYDRRGRLTEIRLEQSRSNS